MFNALPGILRRPVSRAPRMHRKTLILDGNQVMVGGSCYKDRMSNWRDTMIRVGGPLPPAIAAAFERAWQVSRRGPPAGTADIDGHEAMPKGWSFAVSGPYVQADPDLRKALPARIAAAERTVSLTTPYLVPERRLWLALTRAAGRGTTVRILMPARSDHPFLDKIGRRFAHALARRGVEMRFYTRGMLHAKVALVDGNWSSVSSFNLDLLSARLNLESGVFSTSHALHDALDAQMTVDLAHSKRL